MHGKFSRGALCATITVAVSAGVVYAASPALAAPSMQTFACSNGQTVTVLTHTANSNPNGGWGTAQIVSGGSGAGTPTSVNATLYDSTASEPVFTFNSVKGGGNANQNQQTITCTSSVSGTVADFVPPGAQLPSGVSPDDSATLTEVVTVVLKP